MKTVTVEGLEWNSLVDAPVGACNHWPYGLPITRDNLVEHLLKSTVMRVEPEGVITADEKCFVIKAGTEAVKSIMEVLGLNQLPGSEGQRVLFGIPIELLASPYGFSVHKIS